MGYHPRIESKEISTFQTTRTRCSELWFVNNKGLEEAILGYVAKFTKRYEVLLYAFSIEGDHIHSVSGFPKGNRASFMRDFNSCVARAVPRYQSNYGGGRVWARRYSAEYLPSKSDIEAQFFYTVLQPVQDGLVSDISEYPGYNCFEDAINERVRSYKVVRWKEYNDARRWGKKVLIEDYTELVELKYSRLPGYEALSKSEYVEMMRKKLKAKTAEALLKRKGKKPFGRENLKRVIPGSIPRKTKTSTIKDHRPRVLSQDRESREQGNAWYFSIYFEHKQASKRYRNGEWNTKFPDGTYKPPAFTLKLCRDVIIAT